MRARLKIYAIINFSRQVSNYYGKCYKDYHILGYGAMWSVRKAQNFRSNVLPPPTSHCETPNNAVEKFVHLLHILEIFDFYPCSKAGYS
jgi:hypothetical protein